MIDILTQINSEYEKYLKEREDLNKEYNKKIKNLEKELENLLKHSQLKQELKLNSIDIKYNSLIKKRKKLLDNIHTYSTFKPEELGKALAKLISSFEEKNYYYTEGMINVTILYFEEQYMESRNDLYMYSLITESPTPYLNKNITLYENGNMEDTINENDMFLYLSESTKTEFETYDNNGNFLLDKKKYPYIKDFIDYIISKKLNKESVNINDEVNNYILENKPKVKTLKRKI